MFGKLIASFDRLGERALYPYGPFVLVPMLILSLGASEIAVPGTILEDDSVATVSLLTELSGSSEIRAAESTIMIMPETLSSARLAFSRGLDFRVLISEEPETAWINRGLYQLERDSLTVESGWFDAEGPLVLLVEGARIETIQYRGRGHGDPPGELEMPPAWSSWIFLGTFLPALFGLGFASAFVKDLAPVGDEEAGRN